MKTGRFLFLFLIFNAWQHVDNGFILRHTNAMLLYLIFQKRKCMFQNGYMSMFSIIHSCMYSGVFPGICERVNSKASHY